MAFKHLDPPVYKVALSAHSKAGVNKLTANLKGSVLLWFNKTIGIMARKSNMALKVVWSIFFLNG